MTKLEALKNELEEHKYACAVLEKEIHELERENMSKRWRAKSGETYFAICSTSNITQCEEKEDAGYNFNFDHTNRYNFGNYFKTLQEAEKVRKKIKLYTQLKDLALRLNKGEKIDWDNSAQAKWHICYKNGTVLGLDDMYTSTLQDLGQIYCLDKNFLEIAKQEIGEENLKKLFE